MTPFRFRAAAALDVRRREEGDAAAALARATAHFHEAKDACAAIERERARARQAQAEQAGRGIDGATLFWHRNWMTRLQATLDQLQLDAARRALAMEQAEQRWRLARRRRLALDRLHDRALARHRAGEARRELKVIDELARLRHAMAGWRE
jgi:flagellar export protein FliJ